MAKAFPGCLSDSLPAYTSAMQAVFSYRCYVGYGSSLYDRNTKEIGLSDIHLYPQQLMAVGAGTLADPLFYFEAIMIIR